MRVVTTKMRKKFKLVTRLTFPLVNMMTEKSPPKFIFYQKTFPWNLTKYCRIHFLVNLSVSFLSPKSCLSPKLKLFSDYFGVISKPCDKSNLDQPGVISTDRININYYERDRQNSFTLLGTGPSLPVSTSGYHSRFLLPVENQVTENDKVIYNKAIDKRSRKERAINIRLRTDKITEKREKGTGFESHKKQVLI